METGHLSLKKVMSYLDNPSEEAISGKVQASQRSQIKEKLERNNKTPK